MSRMSTKMFIFAAGAAIGSAMAWLYAKKYYEKIADDEIASMKEWVARRLEDRDERDNDRIPDEEVNPSSPSAKPDLKDYMSMVNSLNYSAYSRKNEPTSERKEVTVVDEVYVIKPEIFGEEDDYEEVSLTHYADGVLTDEQDNPIEDVDGTVGEDYASYFGVYEDDAVYVRNDRLKIDFEILADQRNFSDLGKFNPHSMEDE